MPLVGSFGSCTAVDVIVFISGRGLQRRISQIARVAGLIFTGYPGQPKSTRQLQASSTLFYEVFAKYDAGNLLLTQADNEVLSQELEISRLGETLRRMRAKELVFARLSPLPRVRLARPSAAFYAFFRVDGVDDSFALAIDLLTRAKVGLAPGAAFGASGEGHLRLCFAASLPRLSQALDRLVPALR